MRVCMLWNKASGPVWRKPLAWCVLGMRDTYKWWQPIGTEADWALFCIGHRNWAWSGSLFKPGVANWWMAGLSQATDVFYFAWTVMKKKMEIMHLVWACQFASTPTPPYCLIYHLLYSLSFPLGPWGHLNWSPVDRSLCYLDDSSLYC